MRSGLSIPDVEERRNPRILFGTIPGRHLGAIDYGRNVTEGERRLTQMGRKIDSLEELERLARHSHGWMFPRNFRMDSSKGYWRRYVLPKIDLETGRAEYRGALPEVLASFGVAAAGGTKPTNEVGAPKPKGKGKRGNRRAANKHRTR